MTSIKIILIGVLGIAAAHPSDFHFQVTKDNDVRVIEAPTNSYVPPSPPPPPPPPRTVTKTYVAPVSPPRTDLSETIRSSGTYRAFNEKAGRVVGLVGDLVGVIGEFVVRAVDDLPEKIEAFAPPTRKEVIYTEPRQPLTFSKTFSKYFRWN